MDRRQRRREPAVVAAGELPHVVVRVDARQRSYSGSGASDATSASARNSCQNACGIGARIIAMA